MDERQLVRARRAMATRRGHGVGPGYPGLSRRDRSRPNPPARQADRQSPATGSECVNPKLEIRNPKQISESQCPKPADARFLTLGFLIFEFVSDFDIRNSDLIAPAMALPASPSGQAMPAPLPSAAPPVRRATSSARFPALLSYRLAPAPTSRGDNAAVPAPRFASRGRPAFAAAH